MKTYDNFYREASTYDLILRRYKERGEQYSDPNFYPTFKVPETKFTFDPINHVWNRVDKFYKGSLYENISTNAIQQGCIGDCYFVSALARIASQKNLVEMLFDPRSDVKCGAVIVYLYAFGRRTPILIDTFLPYKRGTRVQIFSHPSDVKFSPWFCLVEKAYAKLCGSFSNIINGTFPRAIYSIFGYFPINKESSDIKGSVFEKLLKWQRKGAVVGTHISLAGTKATVNEIKDNGLVANHAYNVLKARVAEGKNFICLRNPWGDHHEWLGDWSDTSELWTESLKKTLGVEVGDNGTFWMIEKDFLYYFSCFQTALPLNPEWHFKSFQTTLMPGPHDGRRVFDPLAKVEERDQFAFKIDGETAAKVYIRIERRGSKKYKDSASFQLLLAEAGGRRITSTNHSTMITATVSLYSDITGFTFPMDNTI
ncbi:hypothetical protein TRFO_40454 [Tritrichomonas foetus]|uniref:Calpain catalytic domain-containing protein n=1 Tax=Tritrichomonas foetus TaxID=1144522 RepID=A0A1J4J734_9EUKA|nr:hypothetical protein TRFO_40454 [Tritrichomonas foetus]|eukprot:OHS93245.1 hypothetical protein TRFO_40454 [Tritrichomonas foetus]